MRKLFSACFIALVLSTTPVSAHKVIMAIYPSGDTLEGELGFSNGDMSVDQLIEVFDEAGNKIGETKTDEDGYFIYQPAQGGAHIFRANLGSGHVAEATAAADQIPGFNQTAAASGAPSTPMPQTATAVTSTIDQAALAKMIRDEVRPLRREIAAYKEKNDLQSILGGIGYIVGIFGVGMYVAARRKLNGTPS